MDDYKTEESVGSELEDRLSDLPKSLIHHILSFLPIRDVVSTTILSKRWENLWTTIPCLNFTNITRVWCEEDEPHIHQVRNFVNRALTCWKGTKLHKFTIKIKHNFDKSLAGDLDLWVGFAVEKKVEELSIHLYESYKTELGEDMTNLVDEYVAPQCLYMCLSIKRLTLEGYGLRDHESTAWNQLESLSIDGFYVTENLVNQILLGAPRLEVLELELIDINVNLNIRSTSLKKLMIRESMYFMGDQPSLDSVLRICCPSLETLTISRVLYGKCLFTDASSLTDVNLGFCRPGYPLYISRSYDARWDELVGEIMWHILSTFQHVERLTLYNYSFEMIRASQKKNVFSPLPNVAFLKVGVCSSKLVEMVDLLEIFPNLRMLVIDAHTLDADTYLEFETNVSKSFPLQLKIVEISSSFRDSSVLGCIKFLLKHGSMLEKLDILAVGNMREEVHLLEVKETLLSLPRSSPTAKVIFNTFLVGEAF